MPSRAHWIAAVDAKIATSLGLTLGERICEIVQARLRNVLRAGEIYSLPKVTLYPILLLTFGLGMSAKVAFGAIHGIIPIALFTINAVRNVRPILIKTGRVLRMNRAWLLGRIVIPAAVPEIFTGLRIGFSLTLIGTVLGEMFASQRGLGYMLMNAIGLHNVDVIMAITLLLVIFAAAVSSALLAIDRRLHRRV